MSTMVIQPYKAEPLWRLGWGNVFRKHVPIDIALLSHISVFVGRESRASLDEKKILEAAREKFNLPPNTSDERTVEIVQQEMLKRDLLSLFNLNSTLEDKRIQSIPGRPTKDSTFQEVLVFAKQYFLIPLDMEDEKTMQMLWKEVLDHYKHLREWSHDMAEGSHHN